MTARSVFAGLQQDAFARARSFDARYLAGKPENILYVSDFDAGFDNWTDHWDQYRPLPPISLTNHAAPFGGRSLMLSTTEGAYVTGRHGNGVNAFRRMTRPVADTAPTDRYLSYSLLCGLGIGGFDNSWGEFGLFIDTNKYDNSSRNFYRLLCQVQAYPTGSRWQIARDSISTNNIVVPGSQSIWHGDNDNKVNFGYVRLTIDRQANGGAGGYHEAQIGPRVFDLTGLGAGSAAEPLQDAGANITRFNGGDNVGLTLARNIDIAGGCQLFVSSVVVTISDQA